MYSIRKKIMLVDNHDSFVYNLKHLVNQASGGCTDIDIMLNDEIAFTKVPQYDLAISLHSNIQARPMPRQKINCSVLPFHFVMPDTTIAQYHNHGWRHSACYLIS